MHNKEDIKDTLVEVRKAYRLLYFYQRGVLDLVKFIGCIKLDFKYKGGYPIFSNPAPKRGCGKLGNWSWDWLNFYFYEFNFENQDKIKLSIFILSDTGFFDIKKSEKDKCNIDNFEDVKTSKTKLIFAIGEWKNNNWKETFIEKEEGEYDKEGKKIFYKHYNLEDFLDEDGAREKLEDFVGFCKKKGISLELKDKIGD